MGRLHGLVNDHEEVGREGVQVDLLVQPSAEGLDGLGRVVAPSVEAPA
jgi:hypothetical protein